VKVNEWDLCGFFGGFVRFFGGFVFFFVDFKLWIKVFSITGTEEFERLVCAVCGEENKKCKRGRRCNRTVFTKTFYNFLRPWFIPD